MAVKGRARTKTQRAWAWAKEQPGSFTNKELRIYMRATEDSSNQLVQRMRKLGGIARTGHTHKARWTVIDRTIIIESMSGTHPNSIHNLRVQWVRTTGNAHPKGKNSGQWVQATDLEKCWQLPMLSVDNAINRRTVDWRVPKVPANSMGAAE